MVSTRTMRIVALAAIAILIGSLLAVSGCSSSDTSDTAVEGGPTALGSLAAAHSSLSTMAPDAKLLVVQMAQSAAPTDTPVWAYLFGSPSNDKTFVVYATQGEVMEATEYGTAGLGADEWQNVPDTESWKIDSDEVYTKALAASGAKGDPAAYFMGMLTFKAAEDTSTVKPFVWQVYFDPGTSGATTNTVEVDANTGAASVAKQ